MIEEMKACDCGSADSFICYESPQCYWVECDYCGYKTAGESRRSLAIHAWNTRAQLPSHVGEAVDMVGPVVFVAADALSDAEQVGMHATRKPNALQCVPLYTHPSDPLPGLRLALDLLTEDGQGFMQKRVIVDKLIELGVTLPPEQLL